MKKLYCDMDGVLVDFVTGALKLVNAALKDPKYVDWKELKALKLRLQKEGRDYVIVDDLEKPEYRGIKKEEVMPEAREFMKVLIAEAGANWWANLPWMRGGRKLWTNIAKYNPRILSAPMPPLETCKRGKRAWIEANLAPICRPNEIVLTKKKYRLAKNNVLIDDFEFNTVPWKKKGGIPIIHRNTSATIDKLEEIIKDAAS